MDRTLQETVQSQMVKEKVIRNIYQKCIRIWQIQNSLDNIASHVFGDGVFSVYPRSSNTNVNDVRSKLENRMKSISNGAGLGMVYKSLAVVVNLDIQHPRPDDVLYDVCLMRQNHPTVILTVIPDDVKDIQLAKRYNLSVTKKLIESIRKFTTHNFSAVFGLMKESDVQVDESFTKSLERIVESKSKLCIPCSLDMPGHKYRSIVSALLSSIACTDFVSSDTVGSSPETVWLLTPSQFSILTECIDQKEVYVKTPKSCGGTVLLLETANRLERFGSSLIISNDQKVLKVASQKKMKTLEPTKEEESVHIEDPVENIISNSSSLTRQQLRQRFPNTERMWIFELIEETVDQHSPEELKERTTSPEDKEDNPKYLCKVDRQISKMISKMGLSQPCQGRTQGCKKSRKIRDSTEIRHRRKRGATFRRSNRNWRP